MSTEDPIEKILSLFEGEQRVNVKLAYALMYGLRLTTSYIIKDKFPDIEYVYYRHKGLSQGDHQLRLFCDPLYYILTLRRHYSEGEGRYLSYFTGEVSYTTLWSGKMSLDVFNSAYFIPAIQKFLKKVEQHQKLNNLYIQK